jgi:hypothetical protein
LTTEIPDARRNGILKQSSHVTKTRRERTVCEVLGSGELGRGLEGKLILKKEEYYHPDLRFIDPLPAESDLLEVPAPCDDRSIRLQQGGAGALVEILGYRDD